MSTDGPGRLTRAKLLEYFLGAAKPRERWLVGMELEKIGRNRETGLPIPYDSGNGPSVRAVLDLLRDQRGGEAILEADNIIGIDAPWGAISLEPGGQVEWSSRPQKSLAALRAALEDHLAAMGRLGTDAGVRWLDVALDPDLPLDAMPWMPKARYNIMRPYLRQRGRLAQRMMTQTASIQCAFDYSDPEDWKRKFRAASLLAPLATALFANSSRMDGANTGYSSYRQKIWGETDPDRCGLPAVVFDPGFGLDTWLDYVLSVPTIFAHRARGRMSMGGIPFVELLEREGCVAVKQRDWETHVSTIFTDVRSYTYIEVRSADLLPDDLAFAVPTLWTGLLYEDDALDRALELGRRFDGHTRWTAAMEVAARDGLAGSVDGAPIRDLAARALGIAISGLENGARCADGGGDQEPLLTLARQRKLEPRT